MMETLNQDLGPFSGKVKQAQGGARWMAAALFPTDGRNPGDVEHQGKNGLADVQLMPDGPDLFWRDGFDSLGQDKSFGAKSHLFFAAHVPGKGFNAADQFFGGKFNFFVFHV